MLDLFNKNQIKELKEELKDSVKNRNYFENMYKEQVKHTNSLIKENTYLINENEKLLDWIQNILKVVNTSEVSRFEVNNTVNIPIYKSTEPYILDGDYMTNKERIDIYIPAIHITNIRSKLC